MSVNTNNKWVTGVTFISQSGKYSESSVSHSCEDVKRGLLICDPCGLLGGYQREENI